MVFVQVTKDDNRQLQNIANAIAAAKKIVVVTGAGISTNCGIPDFRSEEGLYSLIEAQRQATRSRNISPRKTKRPLAMYGQKSMEPIESPSKSVSRPPSIPTNIKGKDLFDAQLWKDPTSTSVFYSFIASLRKTIQEDIKRTTPTHRFIRTLRDKRQLVRCYTQNIDGLESREDLCTDMERGKGNRARFTKRSMNKPKTLTQPSSGDDLDGGCEVVQLHGDLEVLRCTLCQQTCSWEDHGREARLLAGKAPPCESCMTTDLTRQIQGKRRTKIGTLRPNIVLYGEEHPSADAIGTISAYDLALAPDLLLVLGTSLHVHGLKALVREFAKSVHARPGGRGKVVFVNLSKPSESVWKDVFDYWVAMDCDEWVAAVRRHRHDIFQTQDEIKLKVVKQNITKKKDKAASTSSAPIPSQPDDDKENILTDSVSAPKKHAKHPLVVITPKKTLTPTKNITTPPKPTAQLHLPTPPPTSHRTPSKRKSLTENYQDIFTTTPSKRRRTTAPLVWED